MTTVEFWHTTPRKLRALLNKKIEIAKLKENEENKDTFNQLLQP